MNADNLIEVAFKNSSEVSRSAEGAAKPDEYEFLCAVDEAVLQGLLLQIEREIEQQTQH